MTIYLEPWQIFLAGIIVGIIISFIMLVIFAVRHMKPVAVLEEEENSGRLRDQSDNQHD